MTKREKKEHDFSIIAHRVVEEATQVVNDTEPKEPGDKKPNYAALGRRGGLKGGPARAKKLTPEQRREIARKAAKERWKAKPTE
ncbi:MAG: histone H1 [Dehalococcoidia bacterium]